MLKKKALKKIILATIALFSVLLIYSFTTKEEKTTIYDDVYYTDSMDLLDVFALTDDNYIAKTVVYVDKNKSLEDKIIDVLEVMIEKNNKNSLLPDYFNPILPRDTKILDVTIDNDIVNINFSKELLNITDEQADKMIEAIVYTLTDIDGILGVTIKVDGEILKYVPHTKTTLNEVLDTSYGINKIYSLSNNKDISKVVLYYCQENNKDFYVPVTKYLNDKREKIDIIIEELSNSYIFIPGLVSFLNNNIKLVNYNISDNIMTLNFNEALYEDQDLKTINEDAFNMIVYSVFDNYDIEKINIFINDTKICEKDRKNIEN